jgi:hypothetical protein
MAKRRKVPGRDKMTPADYAIYEMDMTHGEIEGLVPMNDTGYLEYKEWQEQEYWPLRYRAEALAHKFAREQGKDWFNNRLGAQNAIVAFGNTERPVFRGKLGAWRKEVWDFAFEMFADDHAGDWDGFIAHQGDIG